MYRKTHLLLAALFFFLMALPLKLEGFNKKLNTEPKKKELFYSLPERHLPSEQEFWTEVRRDLQKVVGDIWSLFEEFLWTDLCEGFV